MAGRASSAVAPSYATPLGSPRLLGPLIEVSARQWSLALTGLALYIWVIHSFKFGIGSVGIGIAVLGLLASNAGLRIPVQFGLLAAWLAWSATTGLAMSRHTDVVLASSIEFAKILVIFFVAANVSRAPSSLILLIGTWLACFLVYPFRGQMVYMAIGQVITGRIGWNYNFANFNDFAAYDLLLMGLAGYVALAPVKSLWRKLALAVFAAAVLSFLVTQSRGGGLAVALTLPLYLLRSRHRTRIILVVGAVVTAIVLAFPGKVFTRITQVSFGRDTSRDMYNEADASTEQRLTIARVALEIAKDNPITGVGVGAYPRVHALYADSRAEWKIARGERDAHNLYLLLLAETGIVGLALFLSAVGTTMLVALRAERQLRASDRNGAEQMRILRFCLFAYMLSALFGTFYRLPYLYLYMAIVSSAAGVTLALSGGRMARGAAVASAPGPVSRRRLLQLGSGRPPGRVLARVGRRG